MSDKDKKNHEEDQSAFKVTDRRQFNAEGQLREESTSEKSAAAEKQEKQEEQRRADQSAETAQEQQPLGSHKERQAAEQAFADHTDTAQVDFSSFLLSLATTAMVHFGEVPDPATGKTSDNLEAGKQMIDILTMLKEKTEGNLKVDESQLLENLLFELRMKYLSKARIINL